VVVARLRMLVEAAAVIARLRVLVGAAAIVTQLRTPVEAAAIIARFRVLVETAAIVAQLRAPVEAAAIITPLNLASGRHAHSAHAALAAATTGPRAALSECGGRKSYGYEAEAQC